MLNEVPMNRLTDNEVNNLVYALIKYGFGKIIPKIKNPPNDLIKDIMLEINDEGGANIPTIINTTLRIVERRFDIMLSNKDFEGLKKYCYDISVAVMKQPFEVRNDLGQDEDSDDFVTKH